MAPMIGLLFGIVPNSYYPRIYIHSGAEVSFNRLGLKSDHNPYSQAGWTIPQGHRSLIESHL